MNRSFTVFAGVASIALALVLSTQISSSAQNSTSAQIITPAQINAPTKIGPPAKIRASAKIRTAANQKQLHRLAVQVDVNDPAVMNLVLNNVSNAAQHYGKLQKGTFGASKTMSALPSSAAIPNPTLREQPWIRIL